MTIPLPKPVKEKLKTLLYPRLYNRRYHAYCVGCMKTGTTSMAGLFEGRFRSHHEPEKNRLIEVVMQHDAGKITDAQLLEFLSIRDKQLWLEMESSGFCGLVIEYLVQLFPDAKYILTYRDCKSWLDSCFNHLLARPLVDIEREFLTWWMQPESCTHHESAKILEEKGLFPLDCYLNAWVKHNSAILEHVAPENLLVLETTKISKSSDVIESFLGLQKGALNSEKSHLYKARKKYDLVAQIDSDYLNNRIEEVCGEIYNELKSREK